MSSEITDRSPLESYVDNCEQDAKSKRNLVIALVITAVVIAALTPIIHFVLLGILPHATSTLASLGHSSMEAVLTTSLTLVIATAIVGILFVNYFSKITFRNEDEKRQALMEAFMAPRPENEIVQKAKDFTRLQNLADRYFTDTDWRGMILFLDERIYANEDQSQGLNSKEEKTQAFNLLYKANPACFCAHYNVIKDQLTPHCRKKIIEVIVEPLIKTPGYSSSNWTLVNKYLTDGLWQDTLRYLNPSSNLQVFDTLYTISPQRFCNNYCAVKDELNNETRKKIIELIIKPLNTTEKTDSKNSANWDVLSETKHKNTIYEDDSIFDSSFHNYVRVESAIQRRHDFMHHFLADSLWQDALLFLDPNTYKQVFKAMYSDSPQRFLTNYSAVKKQLTNGCRTTIEDLLFKCFTSASLNSQIDHKLTLNYLTDELCQDALVYLDRKIKTKDENFALLVDIFLQHDQERFLKNYSEIKNKLSDEAAGLLDLCIQFCEKQTNYSTDGKGYLSASDNLMSIHSEMMDYDLL